MHQPVDLVPKSQHALDQIFRHVFINAVVAAANGGVDAKISEDLLWNLGDLRQHQLHFDLIRKLPSPHFRHEPLAAVAGGLPEAEEAPDLVVMQQTVVTYFDLQRPRLIGAEQVFVDAVEVRRTAAFKDESVV
jgi:hypothetical protein